MSFSATDQPKGVLERVRYLIENHELLGEVEDPEGELEYLQAADVYCMFWKKLPRILDSCGEERAGRVLDIVYPLVPPLVREMVDSIIYESPALNAMMERARVQYPTVTERH